MARGPLKDIRVLDLTHVWAGPLATRILGDLGAQILKIEAPMGRGPRKWPPVEPIGGFIGGEPGLEPYNTNAVFVKLQRNKKSLALDLKSTNGRDVFLQLVEVSDIVIENFSARAMNRLQLDYPNLKKANPKIIHVAMPGYGLDGPYRDRVAFGPTVEPMCGLPFAMGYGKEEPRATAMAMPDPSAAVSATAAVMTALRHRERTGEGGLVEMSLHESAVSFSGPWIVATQRGETIERYANKHPTIAPHGVYRCAGEDSWLALACRNTDSWPNLAKLLGLEHAAMQWNLEARIQNQANIDEAITNYTTRYTCDAATENLQAIEVAAGPVYNTQQMCDNPQSIHRGFFVPLEDGTPMPGNPLKMNSTGSDDWTPCPKLGLHNEEILADWLGYDQETIDALYAERVIVNQPPR